MKKSMLLMVVFALILECLSAQTISIVWSDGKPNGIIEIANGELGTIVVERGTGRTEKGRFEINSKGEVRIKLTFSKFNTNYGSNATIVTVNTSTNPFSFFLRDVNKNTPIWIPEYNVMVTEAGDSRSFAQIENDIRKKGNLTNFERINKEPEESYEKAASENRNQTVPTWLGISRDMRIFEISNAVANYWREADCITPRNSSSGMYSKLFNGDISFEYAISRGQGVQIKGSRWLEDGMLPILHSAIIDEDVTYNTTAFVTLEESPLTQNTSIGTHFMVADNFSGGHMFTKAQEEELKPLLKEDSAKKEETVLYFRAEAINNGGAPRYTFFKTPKPGYGWWMRVKYSFDKQTGFTQLADGSVCVISRLNGQPLPNEEMAVLLQPGEKATFEFCIPHNSIATERAVKLAAQSFDNRLGEAKIFWNNKLDKASKVHVPEKRIDEMMQAGLLHLDLITYGNEPGGTLAPSIGVYSPIGTESSPIIQYYCSRGLKDEARRTLQYFFDKQHEDGMIQNFGGYMVETGAALYTAGEYYRYTKDDEWVRSNKAKLIKACEYLIKWREKNKNEKLRGRGYGMIDGKVADPEDQYHQYMLNAYAYIGIIRTVEMLASIDPSNAKKLKAEAEAWKKDIRESLVVSLAHSPVIPMGNGAWVPTLPPWTEAQGPQMLYLEPTTGFSHGTFTVKDALIGPLYLVFCEVLDPQDEISKMILNYHSELMFMKNVSFSQPYYTRNDWVELKLGMVKSFLKTFYNTFPAIADRQTYTFYEHLHQVSVHKTHEEAWFLMQTRWMLYMEDGNRLNLLPGIPRAWLEDDKIIEVQNALCYFGKLSFTIKSDLKNGKITANIECPDRLPSDIVLRIPHPQGKQAVKVAGGTYNAADETVLIKPFSGRVEVMMTY